MSYKKTHKDNKTKSEKNTQTSWELKQRDEIIKYNHPEILELKNRINEMKNAKISTEIESVIKNPQQRKFKTT